MGSPETARLLADPRVSIAAGDGRKSLLAATGLYDVVAVDALRPAAAYNGNVYSVEFYELVRSRLAPGGLFSQWVATEWTLESVRRVFPHLLVFQVPEYYQSSFVVASMEPIRFDREQVLARQRAMDLARAFPSGQHATLPRWIEQVQPHPATGGRDAPEERLNRDLHARNEYFLNN